MNETLWKQSLGRSVSLGDCYDATTEQFTGRNIFNKKLTKEVIREHNIRNQSWNYDFSNSTASKLSMFSLDGELKLSLLCDVLPNIAGSAKFVKNSITNKEEIRCTFALFTNTIEQRIEIDDVDLLNFYNDHTKIDSFKGTHVVTRLKWGANAVAELFIENDENLGKMEITGAIKANLGKIADIALSDASITGNVKYENFNLSKINKIRWSVNADVDLNTKTPKNAEEALNIIYHLPEKIKEEGNGRPLEFCLLPLKELKETLGCTKTTNAIFHKIQNSEILKVEHQFKEIETSRLDLLTLRDLMMRNIDYVIPNDLKTLKEFMNIFDISFTQFQQSISTKLNEVRSGKADQNQLLAVVETFKKESNAASPKVEEFIASFKTAERRINMLKDILQKGIIFIKNHAAFESTMLISNKDIYILSYSFNKIKENRQWLENYQYFCKLNEQHKDEHMFCMIDFDITPEIQSSQDLAAEPQIHKVFNGKFVVKNILKEIKLFESVCSVRCTQVHEKENHDYEKLSPVQFPCPNASNGGQCSKKSCDWYCVKCFSILEYGFNDKFYCHCGCQKIENFEFKCDDHMHGNIYVKYSDEQLKSYIANIKKREEINILLLGQIGAGKTSLIKTAESICFEMMRHPSLKDNTQSVGLSRSISDDEDLISSDNEDEEAKTTECQAYHIPYGKCVLKFIDTPGLGDCRGINQDKKHLEKIFSFAEKCGSLNAICIFIKRDKSIVSQYCLMEYLSNFPQMFAKNILFCFSYDVKADERKKLLHDFFKDYDMDKKIQKLFLSSHFSFPLINIEEENPHFNTKIFHSFIKHVQKLSPNKTEKISQSIKAHADIDGISKSLFHVDQEIDLKRNEITKYSEEKTKARCDLEKQQKKLQNYKGTAKWQLCKDECEVCTKCQKTKNYYGDDRLQFMDAFPEACDEEVFTTYTYKKLKKDKNGKLFCENCSHDYSYSNENETFYNESTQEIETKIKECKNIIDDFDKKICDSKKEEEKLMQERKALINKVEPSVTLLQSNAIVSYNKAMKEYSEKIGDNECNHEALLYAFEVLLKEKR